MATETVHSICRMIVTRRRFLSIAVVMLVVYSIDRQFGAGLLEVAVRSELPSARSKWPWSD
jgi:hypothetical protein